MSQNQQNNKSRKIIEENTSNKKQKQMEKQGSDFLHQSVELHYDNANSRIIGAIGKEALKKLQQIKILIIGMGGLGAEISKNICLMGVQSLTIYDESICSWEDLSSSFFLTEQDVVDKKSRADASLPRLTELNERVRVTVHNGGLSEEFLKEFSVICVAQSNSLSELKRISNVCHANKIHLIVGEVRGLFGGIFVDLGSNFQVLDKNGETPKTAYIESITHDDPGLVTVVESARHDLEDGDVVQINEVQGMTEVNNREFTVKVTGGFTFSIDANTKDFQSYIKGGKILEIKKPVVMNFRSLEETLNKPDVGRMIIAEYGKMELMAQNLLAFETLLTYLERNNGATPRPYNVEDAASFFKLAGEINATKEESFRIEKLSEKFLNNISFTARAQVNPMCAFFGGIIAQEVIKSVSQKFSPIAEWFFFDSFESLIEGISEKDIVLKGTR